MIINRFVTWPARVGISLAALVVGLLVVTIERPGVRAAAQSREPAPAQGTSKASDAPVRAYDQPAPKSARFHTVTLTVLDDETSRPLADVEIGIRNHVDGETHVFRTDSNGRLRFDYPSLHDDPKVTIEVCKNGYVPLVSGWGGDDGREPSGSLTLRLRRGTTMGGIVVGAADRPVQGVTVLVSVTHYGQGARAPNATGIESYWEVPTLTGPDGRWRTDSVPPGADGVRLQLWHPDYVCDWPGRPARSPKVESVRNQSDRQVLLRGLRVNGRVADEQGRPIPGAVIDGFHSDLDYSGKACDPSDAEGRFHIHLARGTGVFLQAYARGYVAVRQGVAADPDKPFVEFRLPRGKRIRGRVVDPKLDPIEAVSVVIPGMMIESDFVAGRTDAEGRFEWDSAPEFPVRLRFEASGFASQVVSLSAGEHESMIVLRPAVVVRLDAVDAQTGAAVPWFSVRIGTTAPGSNALRWGPRIGRIAPHRFEAELDAGKAPYQIEIAADGYAPATIVLPREGKALRTSIKLEKVRP
jgi:hypothetical protein